MDPLQNTSSVIVTPSECSNFFDAYVNPYAQVLYTCEDDQYELDMIIELCISTIDRIKQLIRAVSLGHIKDVNLNEHLNGMD